MEEKKHTTKILGFAAYLMCNGYELDSHERDNKITHFTFIDKEDSPIKNAYNNFLKNGEVKVQDFMSQTKILKSIIHD